MYIYGAGGHGRVVLEAAFDAGLVVDGFIIDDPAQVGFLRGIPVISRAQLPDLPDLPGEFHMAIGDNRTRARKYEEMLAAGWHPVNIIHPHSWVSPSAQLGPGTFVSAGVCVNADARIGANCIINTGATVEHDCVVGPHAHLAPRTAMAGNAVIGTGAYFGLGSVIIGPRRVGDWSQTGAGSVVVRDIPDACKAYGVPARVINKG